MSDQNLPLSISELLLLPALNGLCGKTSRAYLARTEEWISESSPIKLQNSGMASHGEFLTLNISESPKDAAECSLSEVLERGGAERAAEILFEQQSLRGDLAPCQGERSDTAEKTGDGAAAANGGGRKRSNTLTPTHGFDQSKRVYTTDGACACLDTHMAGNYIYQED